MKKLLLGVLIVLALFILWWTFPFIVFSPGRIERQVATATPVGASFEQVERFVLGKGWEVVSLSRTAGFDDQRARPPVAVGTMHIRATAVSYDRLFGVDITVYWGFNDSGELIDTWVWRTVDAL